MNSGQPLCLSSTLLDVKALADRLGSEHGAMHDGLVRLSMCTRCEAEGSERRRVFFMVIPDYAGDTSPPLRS